MDNSIMDFTNSDFWLKLSLLNIFQQTVNKSGDLVSITLIKIFHYSSLIFSSLTYKIPNI